MMSSAIASLSDQLVELDERIAAAQAQLALARDALNGAVARHVLGDPDSEGLATARALVIARANVLADLLTARETERQEDH